MEVRRSSCFFCTSKGCAVKVHVEGHRVRRVTIETRAPVQPGGYCVRPTLAADYQHHPFRLDYPLRRAGARGENRWEPISWEQAFDEIAEKLASIRDRYGAEAVATSSGTGRGGAEFAKTRFMNLFGSPNRFGVITICYAPRAMVWFATFGGHLVPDRKPGKTRMAVLWGRNPHEGGPSSWKSFLKAKAEGMRTLVIDPRCTEPARQADRWVQIRPGTDAALALGMIDVLIQEGLYDREFVRKHTFGFDRLAERARAYPPERVAAITGLTAEAVRDVARFYGENQPSTLVIGVAAEHGAPNGIQAIRAINLLRAIAGSIDVEGGDLISGPHPDFLPDVVLEANEALPPEQRKKQLGSDRFRFLGYRGWELIEAEMRRKWGERHSAAANLHSCAHAPTAFRAMLTGKPYPVKALLVSASNPLLSYANTRLVHRALLATDLLVTLDLTWTPTARLSDYVLPAACWMERPDMGNFASVGGYPVVQVGVAAVPARVPGEHDRRNDYEFWRELGVRLGQAEQWPWKTFEELWEYRIAELMAKTGARDLEEFVARKGWAVQPPRQGLCAEGLATPSGKVELASQVLERLGYDPLPDYVEPTIPAEIRREYPLVNVSGVRVMPYHHSEFRHVAAFRERHPDPIVEVHADTARRKGIVDGDWVWIETPLGRVKQRARLTTSFDPRYIVTQHSWWFPEMPGETPSLHGLYESNINVTTDDDPDKCDPLSGGWPFKGQQLRCRIRKVNPDSPIVQERKDMNILIFGPNGSGKGTQGALVQRKLGVPHIESGVIFRKNVAEATELGKKAKFYMDRGDLVPDGITIPMILGRLQEGDARKGWLLDGFPRNEVQAESLAKALQTAGIQLDVVIEIVLDRETAKLRIMGRRVCVNDNNHPNHIAFEAIKPVAKDGKLVCRVCGGELKTRADDQDETAINKRHDIYYKDTMDAIRYFKGLPRVKVISVDGSPSIPEVSRSILQQLC